MKRFPTVAAGVTLAAVATLAASSSAQVGTRRVASGLNRPVFVTHAPGDDARIFFLEKRGVVRVLALGSGTITDFLNIDALVGGGTSDNDERGLLGLAFHQSYQSNGSFYVFYTNNSSDTVVSRWSVLGDPATSNTADTTSESVLLTVDQPQTNHNGGWIGFGPNDGYLYIALGDGGNACDSGTGHTAGTGNAQDITGNLLGKILRIDVDSGSPYGIPATNPFVGVTGDDEIWVYGLRNPYRCSFDSATGDLWIGDVGQDVAEEISFQAAGSAGGENYGWRCMEGNECSTRSPSSCGATTGCLCPTTTPGLTAPVHDYLHSSPPAPTSFVCSVTGGYVYRGSDVPSVAGAYFFADFCGNAVWSFEFVGGVVRNFTNRTPVITPSLDGFTVNQIVSFGEDNGGELYIVDQGTGTAGGQIFRLVGCGDARVVSDNPGGTNPASYTVSGTPSLGGTISLFVNASGTTGHTNTTILGYLGGTTATLGGGQVLLVDVGDPNGELLNLGLQGGDTSIVGATLPNDTSFCGLEVYTQALHVLGVRPFALSNRQTFTVGL